MAQLYKIMTQKDWDVFRGIGTTQGSADDMRDGFIHLSTADQLQATLDKHYKGQPHLLILTVEEKEIAATLRWEPARGGDLFPHIYGPLPLTAISKVRPLAEKDEESKFGEARI